MHSFKNSKIPSIILKIIGKQRWFTFWFVLYPRKTASWLTESQEQKWCDGQKPLWKKEKKKERYFDKNVTKSLPLQVQAKYEANAEVLETAGFCESASG